MRIPHHQSMSRTPVLVHHALRNRSEPTFSGTTSQASRAGVLGVSLMAMLASSSLLVSGHGKADEIKKPKKPNAGSSKPDTSPNDTTPPNTTTPEDIKRFQDTWGQWTRGWGNDFKIEMPSWDFGDFWNPSKKGPQYDFMIRPRDKSQAIGWPENVRAVAASSGDYYAWYNSSESNPHFKYSTALHRTIRNPDELKQDGKMPEGWGIEAAVDHLETHGYTITTPHWLIHRNFSPFSSSSRAMSTFPSHLREKDGSIPFRNYFKALVERKGVSRMFPTSTDRQLHSWQIGDEKQRFAILTRQNMATKPIGEKKGSLKREESADDRKFNRAAGRSLDGIEGILRDDALYGMGDDQIQRYDDCNAEQLFKSLTWVASKAKRGDEILFYYAGHGTATKPKESGKEGDTVGTLSGIGLRDKMFQDLVKKHLGHLLKPDATDDNSDPPAKLLIILDACMQGSSTAMNEPHITDQNREMLAVPTFRDPLLPIQLKPDTLPLRQRLSTINPDALLAEAQRGLPSRPKT